MESRRDRKDLAVINWELSELLELLMAQEGTDLGGAGQDEGHRVVIGEEQIGPPLLLLVAQLDREHLER